MTFLVLDLSGSFESYPLQATSMDWTIQPPYCPRKDCNSIVYWTGHCQCRRIMFNISRQKPLDAKFCHCKTCQILHGIILLSVTKTARHLTDAGAPFQWAAIFYKTDVSFTCGVNELIFYNVTLDCQRHELPCKVSCAHCHSPLMDEGRNMALLFPESLDFRCEEDKNLFAPRSVSFL